MYNTTCYDSNDRVINNFTQWDLGQKITIKGTGITEPPIVHFANKNSSEALSVQSTLDNSGNITVDVPNVLLQDDLILDVYIYELDGTGGKTLYKISIPVSSKPKPSDYIYSDNVDYITVENVLNEIREFQQQIAEGTKFEVISNTDDNYTLKLSINGNSITTPNLKGAQGEKGDTGEKGTGIDDWVSALDLSAHSSKANALDILTLPAGGYIVTAGGYINVTGAGATEALDLSKGAYIAATSQGVSIVDGGSQYYLYSGIENSNSAYLPTYEEVEEMVAEKADEIKAVTRIAASGNVSLTDKSDYRFEELSTLNLSLPATVPDIFECNITFESGETATILSYPADTIEFIGNDCDADGDFVPATNKTYELNIKNLGYGRIRAFVKALEAQPVTVTPNYFVSARYNDWVRGAVTNGVFQDSTVRIRSGHHFYATGTEVIVKIPSGYQMTVSFYSKSGSSYVYQGELGGWLTGTASFTIEDGVNYVAFMYGLVNNTVAEPADGLNVEFLIKQPAQT